MLLCQISDAVSKSCRVLNFELRKSCGVKVTVNTDNIGISGGNLTKNLIFLSDLCPGITRLDLLQLQRNAVDGAFVSHEFRQSLMKRFDDWFMLNSKL